jgi:hypothetical protein
MRGADDGYYGDLDQLPPLVQACYDTAPGTQHSGKKYRSLKNLVQRFRSFSTICKNMIGIRPHAGLLRPERIIEAHWRSGGGWREITENMPRLRRLEICRKRRYSGTWVSQPRPMGRGATRFRLWSLGVGRRLDRATDSCLEAVS